MDEVTIIIKTLDRCDCLINLLDSIFKKYPKTWRAIPFLSKIPSGLSLSDSLVKWIELSPIEAHTGLQKMAELFGASMPFPS